MRTDDIMDVAVYTAVRYFVIAKELITSRCCPRKPKSATTDYEEVWSSENSMTFRTVTASSGYETRTKVRVYYDDCEEPAILKEAMFFDCRPPWFFIGCDGNQDKTSDLEPYICRGNKIRPELLRHLFPGSKKWVYIHPTTFEETDFPSKGIAIEYD